jgi:hypothetical protein
MVMVQWSLLYGLRYPFAILVPQKKIQLIRIFYSGQGDESGIACEQKKFADVFGY